MINTSSNSTNLLIYNRCETFYINEELKEEKENAEENATNSSQTQPFQQIEEIKNTKKNRKAFKDLDFIYNEQQVFKLSRQIW